MPEGDKVRAVEEGDRDEEAGSKDAVVSSGSVGGNECEVDLLEVGPNGGEDPLVD